MGQSPEVRHALGDLRRRRAARASPASRPSARNSDAVGVGGGDRVVGDHDDRLAEVVDDVAQQREDLAAGAGVERAGRLVGEHDLGPGDQRAGDGDALLLAAGELGGPVAQAVGEPDAVDDLAHQARSARPPARRSGRAMFCATVSAGIRLKAWKTKPTRSRRSSVSRVSLSPASSTPPRRTMPEVGPVEARPPCAGTCSCPSRTGPSRR